MTEQLFETGDRVRHVRRPEWGVGSVVKSERASVNGTRFQRLSVRFPHAGLKTISTAHGELEAVTAKANGAAGDEQAELEKMGETEWLAPIARKKLEELLTSVPPDARDPFNSLGKRLAIGLDLYRFERSGRGLVDWAIAQTGLDDPLSEFSRQELEQLFERWATERDAHLARLLEEAKSEPERLTEALAACPAAAREAARRITGER